MIGTKGKGPIWGAMALYGGWAAWRFVRYGEDPLRRIGGTLGLGAMLLLLAEVNEKLAVGLAWLTVIAAATGQIGAGPKSTNEGFLSESDKDFIASRAASDRAKHQR